MKLSEGQVQLMWGAAIAVMLLAAFYVRIPSNTMVFGAPIALVYFAALTCLSLLAAFAVAVRELAHVRNASVLDLINCTVLALSLSALVQNRGLTVANLLAAAIDLTILTLVLVRRNRPKGTQ